MSKKSKPVSPERYSARKLITYVLAGVTTAVFAFPVYWILLSSLKPVGRIREWPPSFITLDLTLDNYITLVTSTNFPQWFVNTTIVTVGNIFLTLSLAICAGYALTRYEIPHSKNLARGLLLAYMFPPVLLGIPYFVLFNSIGINNSYLGIVLAHASLSLPLSTWIMWQFFQTVPISWEESAWICGASRFRTMLEIAVPGVFPGIAAVAIFTFSVSWNDFTLAYMVTSDPSMTLMTVGLRDFMQGGRILWGDLTAGASILIIPPIILVFTLNKYILEGFSFRG